MENELKLFEQQKIRAHWDEEQQKWYFSISDVIAILTESIDPLAYWRKLKERLKKEGNETVTNCHGLKKHWIRKRRKPMKKRNKKKI